LNTAVTLYDDDTIPESTRTLAAIMDSLAFGAKAAPTPTPGDPSNAPRTQIGTDVRAALARLGGRKGYRTLSTALGVARPVLAYPKMNDVVDDTIRLIGPGGAAEPQLRKLLAISQGEMQTSVIPDARKPITGYADIWSGSANAKPKLTSEILRNFLIDPPPLTGDLTAAAYPAGWQDKYGITPAGTPAPVLPALLRDARGFAAFVTIPSNALDADGDGLPDTNAFGQFLSKAGAPLALPTPFPEIQTAGTAPDTATRDAQGRALQSAGGAAIYKTMDASRTVLAPLLRESKLVADPASGALLDLLHAATFQFGPRSAGTDATDPTIGPDLATYADPSGGPAQQIPYRKFDASKSPILDLAYATTSFLQYPKMGDYLELTRQLMRDHPDKVARVIAAALKIRNLANQPAFAAVSLDSKSALWDDVIGLVQQIAAQPDLMKEVIEAMANDDMLLNQTSLSSFFLNIDKLDYDPAADACTTGADAVCPAINNPVYDTTVGKSAVDPSTPNDLTKDDETNRSLFERFTSLMRESWHVPSCNKDGAQILSDISIPIIGTIHLTLPLGGGTYSKCQAVDIPDLAIFYLGCVSGGTDEVTGKARCTMPVNDGVVGALNSLGLGNTLDSILESTSGINGMTQTPTTSALNRLVFWQHPNKFITSLLDPMPSAVCPVDSPTLGTRTCASPDDLLWTRQKATIFMGESMKSLQGMAPMITPFVKRRGADHTSHIDIFLGLMSTLNMHWGTGHNTVRCDPAAAATDVKFCTGSNVRQYEVLLSQAIATDLLPALNDLTKTTMALQIRGQSGTDVMVSLVADLLLPENATGIGLKDRKGNVGTTRNDGQPIAQVTPFYLFANALNAMDAQWIGTDGAAAHALWKQARGKLIDSFVKIDQDGGDPTKSHFHDLGMQAALPMAVELLADRIAQHTAAGDMHTWATTTMINNLQTSMSGPLFATAIDLQEQLYADTAARATLSNLIVYLLDQASTNDALANVVTGAEDILQVVGDDTNMVPLEHGLAVALAPDGATKRSLDLLEKFRNIETSASWIAAHAGRRVLPLVVANAVTPMTVGGPAPIEVIADLVADIQRADPTTSNPFDAEDYGSVTWNVEDFLIDKYRGLEQLYVIIKNRNL
ncbi:MAG: hypothetical protein ACHREM_19695, partial [Polyangiales bacterium]